jgi:hypothetical protein
LRGLATTFTEHENGFHARGHDAELCGLSAASHPKVGSGGKIYSRTYPDKGKKARLSFGCDAAGLPRSQLASLVCELVVWQSLASNRFVVRERDTYERPIGERSSTRAASIQLTNAGRGHISGGRRQSMSACFIAIYRRHFSTSSICPIMPTTDFATDVVRSAVAARRNNGRGQLLVHELLRFQRRHFGGDIHRNSHSAIKDIEGVDPMAGKRLRSCGGLVDAVKAARR